MPRNSLNRSKQNEHPRSDSPLSGVAWPGRRILAECGWRSVGKPHGKSEYVWMFERVTIPHHQAGLTCDHDGTFSLICQAKES